MSSQLVYCAVCGAANDAEQAHCFACQARLESLPATSAKDELLHKRYRLLEQLGSGGFGAVYRAEDVTQPQQPIAIKQINLRDLTARQIIEATETFERERALLASLNHPRLPHLHATFEDTEHWYLVIDYFPGQTLEEYLARSMMRDGRLQSAIPERAWIEETLHCGRQLCEILDYLHMRMPPVIFRDLKPGNIIRGPDGSYSLIDFGIARTTKPGQARDTIPLGSPGYAAPEQYGRAQTDARADLYSLGAIMHQMLSGHDPSEQPLHFAPLNYSEPALSRLEALILKMVALPVDERPASAPEVGAELRLIEEEYRQPGQRIWIPPVSTPVKSNGSLPGTGQIQVQIQQPPASRQVSKQARQMATSLPNRKRRRLLIAGMMAGIGIVGGGSLGVYLANRSHTNNLATPWTWMVDPEGNSMLQAAWSSDSKYLATTTSLNADGEGPVNFNVWDIQRGRNIFVPEWNFSAPAGAQSFAWSPAGRQLALAASDSTVFIYEIVDDRILLWQTFGLDDSKLGGQSYNSRGASIGGQLTPAQIQQMQQNAVMALAWSPNGAFLACVKNANVYLWDIQKRRTNVIYRGHSSEANPTTNIQLQWSPDGAYMASVIDGGTGQNPVHIWHTLNGKRVALVPALYAGTTWLQWSPDSTYLVFGNGDDYVNLYDRPRGLLLNQFQNQRGQGQPIYAGSPLTAWSPDGRQLATFISNPDSVVQLWTSSDLTNPASAPAASWTIKQMVQDISWSPDGKYILVICMGEQAQISLLLYDAQTHVQKSAIPAYTWSTSAAWSPDGRSLAVWGQNDQEGKLILRIYPI